MVLSREWSTGLAGLVRSTKEMLSSGMYSPTTVVPKDVLAEGTGFGCVDVCGFMAICSRSAFFFFSVRRRKKQKVNMTMVKTTIGIVAAAIMAGVVLRRGREGGKEEMEVGKVVEEDRKSVV